MTWQDWIWVGTLAVLLVGPWLVGIGTIARWLDEGG